jgi:hypothetical protein
VNVIEQVGPERQSILEQIAGNGTVSTWSALRFASHEVLPDHHRVAGPQPIGARSLMPAGSRVCWPRLET